MLYNCVSPKLYRVQNSYWLTVIEFLSWQFAIFISTISFKTRSYHGQVRCCQDFISLWHSTRQLILNLEPKFIKSKQCINVPNNWLQEVQAAFRQTLTESALVLKSEANHLGKCVEKARPYYQALDSLREVRQILTDYIFYDYIVKFKLL